MGAVIGGLGAYAVKLGATPVIKMQLGDEVVWDGRVSVNVTPPRLIAAADAVAPAVVASAVVAVPAAMLGAAEFVAAPPPEVTAGAEVDVPTSVAAAVMHAPVVQTDNILDIPTMTAVGGMGAPEVAGIGDVNLFAPSLAAAAALPVPVVSAGAAVAAPTVAAYAQAEVPTVAGHYTAAPAALAAAAALPVPTVTASAAVDVPTATASATAVAPVVSGGSNVDSPALAATGTMPVPTVQTFQVADPAGLLLEDDVVISSSTWTVIPAASWFATWASYPLTVDSGNGFEVNGAGNVTFRIKWHMSSTSTTFSRGMRVKVNGTVVYTQTSTTQNGDYTSGAIAVADGDVVTVEIWTDGTITAQRTFQPTSSVEMVAV